MSDPNSTQKIYSQNKLLTKQFPELLEKPNHKAEIDTAEYLSQSGIVSHLNLAMAEVLSSRCEDPLKVMRDRLVGIRGNQLEK